MFKLSRDLCNHLVHSLKSLHNQYRRVLLVQLNLNLLLQWPAQCKQSKPSQNLPPKINHRLQLLKISLKSPKQPLKNDYHLHSRRLKFKHRASRLLLAKLHNDKIDNRSPELRTKAVQRQPNHPPLLQLFNPLSSAGCLEKLHQQKDHLRHLPLLMLSNQNNKKRKVIVLHYSARIVKTSQSVGAVPVVCQAEAMLSVTSFQWV